MWSSVIPLEPVTVSPDPSPQSTSNVNPAAWSAADGSVASRVTVRVWPRTPSDGPATAAVGATLFTVIVAVIVFVAGPSPGANVNAPVAGSMPAPSGAPGSSENATVSVGSGLVAVAVKVTRPPSSTV